MQISEVYRKLRFTLRYLLSNLHDYDPHAHAVPHAELPFTDRHMLRRLSELLDGCQAAYTSYQFSRAFQVLHTLMHTPVHTHLHNVCTCPKCPRTSTPICMHVCICTRRL